VRIVPLAATGAGPTEIARVVGCSLPTARLWPARFAARGIPGPVRPATAGPPGGARPVGQARGRHDRDPAVGAERLDARTLAAHLAGRFATREHLEAQIIDFTLAHNETAEPYQWRYDADAEHARDLDRHPTRPPDPSTEVLPRAA
jgi:hypothetical protein